MAPAWRSPTWSLSFCISGGTGKEEDPGAEGKAFPFCMSHFSLSSFRSPFLSSFCEGDQRVFVRSVVSTRPRDRHPKCKRQFLAS